MFDRFSNIHRPRRPAVRPVVGFALACVALLGCREAPDQTGAEPVSGRDGEYAEELRERVYVSNEETGDITVLDSSADRVVGHIPIGKRPGSMRLSADGKTLYVAVRGSVEGKHEADAGRTPSAHVADGIAVIDTLAQRVVRVLPSSLHSECFALSPDERRMYLGHGGASLASVLEVSTGRLLYSLPVRGVPEAVSVRPDGGVFYVVSKRPDTVTVIDAERPRVVAALSAGPAPREPIFTPDGSKAFVSSGERASVRVIDARRHQVLSDIRLPDPRARGAGLALSPDGHTLFASSARGQVVYLIDVGSLRVVSQVENIGARPLGMGLTSDGRKLYAANGPSNDVAVIDVHKGRVMARIQVGRNPQGIVVAQ